MPWDFELGEFYDDGSPLDRTEPFIAEEPAVAKDDTWITPTFAFTAASHSESPIESRMATQLIKQRPDGFWVEPQYQWRGWRIDFAILDAERRPVAFVECDGAAFHSSAPQLQRDRRKDAEASDAGIIIIRFTGSQIYRGAQACAVQVWGSINGSAVHEAVCR